MIGGVAASAPALAQSYIQLTLEDPKDLNAGSATYNQYQPDGSERGLPYGTGLTIEWWEWRGGEPQRNDNCTFSLNVDANGTYSAPAAIEYTAIGSREHRFRFRQGCSPGRVNVQNSFLKIYPNQSEVTSPIMVQSVKVSNGSTSRSRDRFRVVAAADRGAPESWSISDVCRQFEYSVNVVEGRLEDDDRTLRDGRLHTAVNANVNPVLQEGPDGADLSSPNGGVVIFPDRASETDGERYALTLCDSGYVRGAGERFPDPNATYSTDMITKYAKLPHPDGGDANLTGQGLKTLQFRVGTRAAALADENVLSVLSYNLHSSDDGTQSNLLNCVLRSLLPFGGNCGGLNGRDRRFREAAESVLAVEPDVVVFTEASQALSSRVSIDDSRRELKAALEEVYTFQSVRPNGIPEGGSITSLLECPDNAKDERLSPDTEIYPDQSGADMVHQTYCGDPERAGLDSGVLIGVRKQSGSILGDAFELYDFADGPDKGAAKGVQYVRIGKGGQIYHVFGSHMQGGRQRCAARLSQMREVAAFIAEQTNLSSDSSERIVFTGDLNFDPILNNHFRQSGQLEGRALTCRNETEYLVQKLRAIAAPVEGLVTAGRVYLTESSMPFSNDCQLNRIMIETNDKIDACGPPEAPGDKSKILDHLFWVGAKPVRSGSVFFRQTADGENNGLDRGTDLSGHYPLLTTLDYRQVPGTSDAINDHSLDAFFGRTSAPGSEQPRSRPVVCPYGVVTPYQATGEATLSRPTSEPDLVCLPYQCLDQVSGIVGDVCNPASVAGPGVLSRKYCRSRDNDGENYVAPCIVPGGYQNLARLPGVSVAASSVGNSADKVIDGDVFFTLDGDGLLSERAWISDELSYGEASSSKQWIEVQLPRPQYINRVRVRPVGTGSSLASLFSFRVSYDEIGSGGQRVSQPFGSGYSYHPERASAASSAPNSDIWTVAEMTKPVLTDRVRVTCLETMLTHNRCAISEIELYGGE
ncbi:MAG: hypothetical protein AAGL90_02125 [Pseudomonadota bacterium]